MTCIVCRDTGVVQCPEPEGDGVYETACTEQGCTAPFPLVAADFTDTGDEPF